MAELDLVIANGTVATASGVMQADIGVRAGRIVAIADRLRGAARRIDAKEMLVLPGGVDAHCHLDQRSTDGSVMADDFLSGTRAAACGGTTTIIPFAVQFKGQRLREAIVDYHRRAAGKAVTDYAFHMIVTDPELLAGELPGLVADGYTSLKIYMTYDELKLSDRQILDVLAAARAADALVMVHAESADCIAWLTDRLLSVGRSSPIEHATSRPIVVEREATHRAIAFSELVDVPILIVHVSSGDAIEQIKWAQDRGLKIHAETCPHYLVLEAKDLAQPGFLGARNICSPPPRDRASQEAVWRGLQRGVLGIVSSDHAPFSFDDPKGKKLHGDHAAFNHVPNGIPGLETRLPLLFSNGVHGGRLSLEQFVALTATNPAKLYGLHPRKGTIAIGADADIAIWDPERKVTIRNEILHHACDYTPYEGFEVVGWPVVTIVRGRIVAQDGKVVAEPGYGMFLPRRPSDAIRPDAVFPRRVAPDGVPPSGELRSYAS